MTIRIYLADGSPDGLRLVERSQWTGIAAMCSRAQYPDVRDREEFQRPGVYVLSGKDPYSPGGSVIYVGQAETASQRLDQHLKGDKDFWEHLVLFTNKDANFNTAHFRYLEAALIERARSAKRAKMENGNQPSAPRLSEPDKAEADAFLNDMLLIYPLLGISAFEQAEHRATPIPRLTSPASSDFLLRQSQSVVARGRYSAEGFIVFAGASARTMMVESTPTSLRSLRQRLLDDGVLVPDGAALKLLQDYRFDSPSAAAGVVLGRSANGRVEWVDETGRQLKDVQNAAIAQAVPSMGAPSNV